jgi:L-fuculose-phosphate aldolase
MTPQPGPPGQPGRPGPGQPGQPGPGQPPGPTGHASRPHLASERASLVAFGRRMVADGLVDGMSGNLSVRAGDRVAITPSGVAYDEVRPAGICLVRLADGSPVGRGRPSTETPMHLAVYRATDAAAVVHTHSPFVVALSTVLDELPAVHYAMAGLGGPVRVAPYARFGTAELAGQAVAALTGRTAVILGNHGALAYGATLGQAYDRARTLEWLARVYWHARQAGHPRTLTVTQLDEVRDTMDEIGYGESPPDG